MSRAACAASGLGVQSPDGVSRCAAVWHAEVRVDRLDRADGVGGEVRVVHIEELRLVVPDPSGGELC